jgi:hypothetical protein
VLIVTQIDNFLFGLGECAPVAAGVLNYCVYIGRFSPCHQLLHSPVFVE